MIYLKRIFFPSSFALVILMLSNFAGITQNSVHVEFRDGKLVEQTPVIINKSSNTIEKNSTNNRTSFTEAISVTISIVPATCQYNNGTVNATATGGTAPYTYSMDGWVQQTGYFPSVSPGNYTLIVTDATNATTS